MTYGYEDATAVIGPLSPTAAPGAFDLCAKHVQSVTVPRGWQMVRLQTDAIREASKREPPAPEPARREVRRPADIAADPAPRVRLSLVPEPQDEAREGNG